MDPTIDTVPGRSQPPVRSTLLRAARAKPPASWKWPSALVPRRANRDSEWLELSAPEAAAAVVAIRDAMLAALPAQCEPFLRTRLHGAKSVQALWFLRCDVAAALVQEQGEDEAARRMREISLRFDGLLPRSMLPRTHASDT